MNEQTADQKLGQAEGEGTKTFGEEATCHSVGRLGGSEARIIFLNNKMMV